MLNKNVSPLGTPGTPEGQAALRKLIQSPPVVKAKRCPRKARFFKDHRKAYITRTCSRKYIDKSTLEKSGFTISMFQLDGIWHMQLTTSLAKILGYKGAAEFCDDNPDDVRTFLTVAYNSYASHLKPPSPDSQVHDTSFIEYNKYKKLLRKTQNGTDFLEFLSEIFSILMTKRDFVPQYHTSNDTQYLPGFGKDEETLEADISLDPLDVSDPETISSEPTATASYKDLYAAENKRLKEQEQHVMKNGTVLRQLEDTVRFLRTENQRLLTENKELRQYRDGLADAFLMKEGTEDERKAKARHIKAMISVAAKKRAESGD